MPCGAVLLCDAVRVRYSKCHTTGTTAVRTRYYMLNHKKCSHSSVQLSPAIAQQRSTAPCGAVRCRVLPCGVVPCRAALCFLSNIQQYQVSCDTRYRPVCMCVCVLVIFFFFIDCPLSVLAQSSLPPPRKVHPYSRSERDIANKHTQQSTAQSALRTKKLLALSNR